MKPAISFAMLCFLVPLCFGSGADTNRTWQPWRIAQNQGINVLFCYLRVHNVPCEYSDLMKEQVHEVGTGPYSANTLVHLAAKRGVSLRVASLTMKEFESCERPVITYMTSDTPDDGAFLLVMNSTDAEVFYIAGAVASIHSMSLEDFRRVWSGIALLESKGWAVDWILFGLALSAAWTVTIGIRWCMAQKKGLRYAHIYRTCAPVTLFCLVAVWAGEAATLPVEVREQLEKQRAALRTVYFEFEQTTLRNDREVTYTNTAYFEGDRFRVKAPSDVSFDGEMMWLVSTHPRNVRPPFILRKTKIRNTTETTPSFNELYWRLPYFEAAGIYFPPYPKDVRTFEALEPMVLRFVENSESIEIMPEGAHLRLRFYVDDWVLLNSREIDPVMFRKQIEGMPISPERKSYEVSILQKTRTMVPKRTVSMLLDSNHSYVPLEREDRSADGQLIARYGVQEWKYFADVAIWLPAKCVVSYFTSPFGFDTFSKEPAQTIHINLMNAEFAARKTEFVLINTAKYRVAGNEVHDETISNMVDGIRRPVILTVAADGSLLNDGTLAGISGNRRVFILILLLILAAPPLLFLLRRSRSPKQ